MTANSNELGRLQAEVMLGSVDHRIAAVGALAQIGNEESEAVIAGMARNVNAGVAVRLAAIENMDWDQQSDLVAQLIRSDPEVDQATLYVAAEKDLSQECDTAVTDSAVAIFPTAADPSSQLAVLHYLFERHPEQFDALVGQARVAQFSPTEYRELSDLVAARRQGIPSLNGLPQGN